MNAPELSARGSAALDATLARELARALDGEVLTDRLERRLYATDASPYEVVPLGVVRPRHREDCVALVRFARRHRVPLHPRGAGTGLAGQSIGRGLVIDFSRHMSAVLEVDAEGRCARVETGVVLDELNRQLLPHGLRFGPDPSTAGRCVIGGMLGTNAWGPHVLVHGSTRDNVLAADAVLGDGSMAHFRALSREELELRRKLPTREGEIYRTLCELVHEGRAAIRSHDVAPVPCNAGYSLAALARSQPWEPDGPPFNLAPFLCGSEGTLALVTEVTLRLSPIPRARRMVLGHFHDLESALRAVPGILRHGPAAVELLDRNLLAPTGGKFPQRAERSWVEGDPAAVLIIELWGEQVQSLQRRAQDLSASLRAERLGYAWPALEPPHLERVWDLRRSSLGLLMGMPGTRQAVPGMEDGAVFVGALPEYFRDVQGILARHGVDAVFYGSVSVGLIHVRPELDLDRREDRVRFEVLMGEIASLVARHGGCFSAKHGDGRLRSPYLPRLLGAEMMALQRRVKQVFDSFGLFNPGQVLDPPPLLEDLRMGPAPERACAAAGLEWPEGLEAAAGRCKGAGVCRRRAGGVMCPSYMATLEERHSTRGRANVFRQVLAGEGMAGLAGEELHAVLDLCLACKGCKAECPADVDIARLKAEFLAHYRCRHGVPLRSRVLAHFHLLMQAGSWWPGPANALLRTTWLRRAMRFSPGRRLPAIAPRAFAAQIRLHRSASGARRRGDVVLWVDPVIQCLEPHIGTAALKVLEGAGWVVRSSPCLSSGRIQLTQGLLGQARKSLQRAVSALYPYAAAGEVIVGLEPSEVATFRDEALDLLSSSEWCEKGRAVAAQTCLLEEFLAREAAAGRFRLPEGEVLDRHVLVHGHCHQRALVGLAPTLEVLALIPGARVEAIEDTCCGMAGSFGYETEHAELSLAIAELSLFPAIRAAPADALVVATGASCRQQIADGLRRRALHPAEVLARMWP
jgi:FAD/FMN-containing dehydrogenase/Fe-S oxidoreductase